MKFEAATIKDIAKELGISTSTVSRALRDNYEISAKTKELVLACAKKLNYRPNPIALSLRQRKSRSIGVVVCEIANSFFSQVINGIESIAYSRGYNIIITQSNESYKREVSDLQYLASRSVDGIIMSISAETTDYDHIKSLNDRGLHFVLFDRVTEAIKTHNVIVDNLDAARRGTNHLIANGYKRIACIGGTKTLKITEDRVAGYRKALQENNIEIDENYTQYCFYCGLEAAEIEEALDNILAMPVLPDAIISMNDKITTGCIKSLKRRKIKILEDIAVIGFFNSDLGDILNPSLTVLRQPGFIMGQTAIELMLNLIESKRPVTDFQTKVLSAELIERESSSAKALQLL